MKALKTIITQFGSEKSQLLLELLLAIALMAILLPTLATGLISSREGKPQQQKRLDAIALLQETQEVARQIRERGWEYISATGTFHPARSIDNTWELVSGDETINGFTRQIVVADVARDTSGVGSITSSGGTNDPSTKKITITVSWTLPIPGSITSNLYMTQYLDNISSTFSSVGEFITNAGPTNVRIISTTPDIGITPAVGAIQLERIGKGDWCNPNENTTYYFSNLPQTGQVVHAAPGTTGQPTRVSVGTGTGASGIVFASINVSSVDVTPIETMLGQMSGSFKTWNVFSDNSYAYLATNYEYSGAEITPGVVKIVELGTAPPYPSPYSMIGYFSGATPLPTTTPRPTSTPKVGKPTATPVPLPSIITPFPAKDVGVAYSDSKAMEVGYIIQGTYLRSFDLSSKNGSRPQIGVINSSQKLPGTAGALFVRGNYAYIILDSTPEEELIIYNITDPANMTLSAWANLNGGGGQDVYVNPDGSRIYTLTNRINTSGKVCVKISPTPQLYNAETDFNNCEFIIGDIHDKSKWGTPITTPVTGNGYGFPQITVIGTYDVDWDLTPKAGSPTPPGNQDPIRFAIVEDSWNGINSNRAILVGVSPPAQGAGVPVEEYKVLDISNEKNPVRCGGKHIRAGIHGVTTVKEADTDSFSYIITNDPAPTPQFQTIQGGPGLYATTGTYFSKPIESIGGATRSFYRINFSATEQSSGPYITNVKLQVGVADKVAGSCVHSNYTYVGPLGTENDYYESSDAIPPGTIGTYYKNPGSCFRFKATLNTNDSNYTPILNNILIIYSP
ncbi:MAG: hypothetical protein WCO06_04950 [Candidatus Roizmanbacteria bacterium]